MRVRICMSLCRCRRRSSLWTSRSLLHPGACRKELGSACSTSPEPLLRSRANGCRVKVVIFEVVIYRTNDVTYYPYNAPKRYASEKRLDCNHPRCDHLSGTLS